MLIHYRRRDKVQRTFLFSPSMRDRLKGLRQVDGKKGSSADLLEENLVKEAKTSGFLLRESKEPGSGQNPKSSWERILY